jgi:hypothetical protein
MVVGPLPRDLKLDAPWTVLRKLELKLSPLQIEPLLGVFARPRRGRRSSGRWSRPIC